MLEVDEAGEITVNQKSVPREELPLLLREIYETRMDKSLFLRAHERLRYAEVVSVLDIARGNGVDRVGIVPP